jgi:hypothetical protein
VVGRQDPVVKADIKLRQSLVGRIRRRQRLQQPPEVVAEVADGTTEERRQSWRLREGVSGQKTPQ